MNSGADAARKAEGAPTDPSETELATRTVELADVTLIPLSGNSAARAPGPTAGGGGPDGGPTAGRQRGGSMPECPADPLTPAAARSSSLA